MFIDNISDQIDSNAVLKRKDCAIIMFTLLVGMATNDEEQSSEVTEALLTHSNFNRVMKPTSGIVDEKSEDQPSDGPLVKLPFPKCVICVLGTKLFERFAFHGTRAVLVIYLTTQLAYSAQEATVVFHGFNMAIYLMTIFGATLSDSWLGKYRTILYSSVAYALGVALLNLGSFPMLDLPAREITIASLLLIACGNGSLKPCLMALGGDQFKRPEQDAQLAVYYSLMYMMLKFAYLMGTALSPTLRNEVKCFGNDHCFPAAFGVPGTIVLLALFSFLLGSKWYVKHKPAGNMIFQVVACIWTALTLKWKNRKTDPKDHWLDNAEPKFGIQLVQDVKIMLNVVVMFLPVPMFYALNEQTGSRWTFQATTMNGDIGFYVIKPDQMQIIMPILVILLIIFMDSFGYKQLERLGLKGSLPRMALGTFLTASAFIIAGSLELHTSPTLAKLPSPGYTQVSIFNSLPCDFEMISRVPELNGVSIKSMDMYKTNVQVLNMSQPFEALLKSNQPNCTNQSISGHLYTHTGYFIRDNLPFEFEQNPRKDINGLVAMRVLVNDPTDQTISFVDLHRQNLTTTTHTTSNLPVYLRASTYAVNLKQQTLSVIEIGPGSVNTILSSADINGSRITNMFEITQPNTVHMLWMIPQYIMLAFGETMVSVTGLSFAYSEAPNSMKSMLQALYLLTVSFGNLIDVIIVGANIFQSHAYQLTYFFGCLMFVDALIFVWLVRRYKRIEYVQHHD